MNIKGAVLAFCAVEVNPSTVSLEIINAAMTEEETYLLEDINKVARIACNVLSSMLVLSSVKEGDLTISYDTKGIENRLLYLAEQFGFEDILNATQPKVRDRSNLW